MMRIAVVGQGRLAATTMECCEPYFDVAKSVEKVDVLWICYDTPIGTDDKPDVDWVLDQAREHLKSDWHPTVVLISSQIPIGTTAKLEREFPQVTFAYSPENIRVATAEDDFKSQARIVVGRRSPENDAIFMTLFSKFTDRLIFTDTETAEMAKHALNCYLGLCIAFANELARIAAVVGADGETVAHTLSLERRVSPHAPLKPGKPFGGGHLARDIWVLTDLAKTQRIHAPIITHIKESNELP